MTYEVVKPAIVKVEHLDLELQFFISKNGKDSGMSQSALAKLCGVGESAIRPLLDKINEGNARTWNSPECLQAFQGKVFSTALKGDASNIKLANIINSDAAAAIIEYYAYESKAANDTAKRSFRAFARVGIETWIKSVTGYGTETSDVLRGMDELKAMMTVLVGEVSSVKEELKDFKRVVTVYPSLDKFKDDMKLLAPFGENFSVRDFLQAKSIATTDKLYRQVRLQVSQTYESLTGVKPERKQTFSIKTGKRSGYEYVYRVEDVPMIEEVVKKALFK